MKPASFYLEKRAKENWIIGDRSHEFGSYMQQALAEISVFLDAGKLPKILIIEPDPVRFLAGFSAAIATECPVFLGNHLWGKNEIQQVLNLVKPSLVWGLKYQEESLYYADAFWKRHIMIPTGGSSGKIRFAIHNWQTLMASVTGFCTYFATDIVNSVCVLPVSHVSGLMQFIRCLVTGGKLVVYHFKNFDLEKVLDLELEKYFISLVPTQLEKMLSVNSPGLAKFKTVLLGGAPAWSELLFKARQAKISLAPTYGMTETASQIATLKPADFLDGNSSSGRVLPHAQVIIDNQTIKIKTKSLYLGYYPHLQTNEDLVTDDIGYLDDLGFLHVLGRNSHKIITGGENVFPSEVEDVIRGTNLVKDVCVIGLEDAWWGQAVTAIYVPIDDTVESKAIASLISAQISKFKQPKHWISVASIPRNLPGKIQRQELVNIAKQILSVAHGDSLATRNLENHNLG